MSAGLIIDTDTHITEPADLWTSRLPAAWGDLVMHVRWDEARKAEVWCIGDRVVTKAWAGCMFGWDQPFPSAPPTLADAHPATYDVKARLRAMDECGVTVSVLYPNIAGLLFDPFVTLSDGEIAAAHVSAYNDFQLDWVSAAPDRFLPMAAMPYWDVPRAVKEVERVAAAGFRGIVTTGSPQSHGQPYLGDRHWDPLWQACTDAGIAVSFHAANGDMSEHLAPARMMLDGPAVTVTRVSTAAFLDNGQQVTDLLCCGVLARFPELNFVSVESGLGWVPFVLESCDYHFKKSRVDREHPEFGDLLPSDLFHRQVYVNFWFEKLEPWHVEAVGADNILFETDFPHPTCLYGDEITAVHQVLQNQPEDVREKILWRNAARLYRLDLA
jgi:predicted TIM-barrel fold metal-dependent hydrolase